LQYSKYSVGLCVSRTSLTHSACCGGNYVDVTPDVKVMNSANLLTVFNPNYLHFTTPLVKTETMGIMFTLLKRLANWFQKAKESNKWNFELESWAIGGSESDEESDTD
jgi:hypothetical protein